MHKRMASSPYKGFPDRVALALRTCLWAAMLGLGLMASGCSGSGFGLKDLLGDDEKPLSGRREAVSSLRTGVLAADPELLAQPNIVPMARSNQSWLQAGGNAKHSMGNLTVSFQPKKVWTAEAGAGSDDEGHLTAPPVVANGLIYVMDIESTLSAFMTSNGRKAWSVSLKSEEEDSAGGVGGGIAHEAGRLYVTTTFGELIALDARRGSIVWRKRLDVPVRAAPTLGAGRIYVAAVNNEVYALSTFNGSVIWKHQGIGEKASRTASNSSAVSGNTVVAPLTTGEILTFDASTGFANWGVSLGGSARIGTTSSMTDISGRPVIEDGRVYAIAHGGSMGGFDLRSGEALWELEVSGSGTPWLAGEYLYTIINNNVLVAISKTRGRARWSLRLSKAGSWAGPVMGNGNLIAASSEGQLVFVSSQTGRPVKKIDLDAEVFISPIIAGNTIYVYTDEAELIALR